MSADLLRRAAEVARESARGGQPWRRTGRSVVRADGSEVAYSARHAAHIALWSPVVALAVASFIECAAWLDLSERETAARERCGFCGCDHLADIARALLGQEAAQ